MLASLIFLPSAGVRSLDHRAIGDGVAVGDADFAHRRTAGYEFLDDGRGKIKIGVTRGQERHECLTLRGAEFMKQRINFGHSYFRRSITDFVADRRGHLNSVSRFAELEGNEPIVGQRSTARQCNTRIGRRR